MIAIGATHPFTSSLPPTSAVPEEDRCEEDCRCEYVWEASTTPVQQPPSCVEVDENGAPEVIFAFDPGVIDQKGCCKDPDDPDCFQRPCAFQANVSISAKDGQTCNFKIKVPGPNPDKICSDAASCSAGVRHNIPCATTIEYVIKANNITIWAKNIKCKNCPRLL
jgi:hypothetical protein